jgi:hypothetical protein
MNNPRGLAQDAAAWYFAQLDPYVSNETNIQTYLRTPLVALTVKALQTTATTQQHTAIGLELPQLSSSPNPTESPGGGVEEHKEEVKSDQEDENVKTDKTQIDKKTKAVNGNGDWRVYLQGYDVTAVRNKIDERRWLQDEYESLSRRTRARMEAFLAGCSLAVPGEVESDNDRKKQQRNGGSNVNSGSVGATVSLQDGLSGFVSNSSNGHSNNIGHRNHSHVRRGPSLTEKMSRSMIGDVTDPKMVQHSQIDEKDLVVRLEVYIRTVQRVRNLNEECVVAMEPPKVIKTRARYITNAFVATTSYVRNINPVLTRLLSCLTMEMLAVECLAEEIMKVIHRVVLEYEHGTSFASLAFLSTPEVNADSLLTPLILKYLKYLQADWERLVKECELERMLARALDPAMRKMFKTIEFRSIGHLLEVCHEYRYKLNNIELPPNVCAIAENIHSLCNSPEAIRQALRDLRREIITVNGHVLPPVTSRKEPIQLLTQTLNSRTLTAKNSSSSTSGLPSTKKRVSHGRRKMVEQKEEIKDGGAPPSNGNREKAPPSQGVSSAGNKSSKKKHVTINSENASDADLDESLREGSENEATIFSSDYESSSAFEDSAADMLPNKDHQKRPSGTSSRKRRSKFHLSTIDVLTRRLLIAASRTGNGGDAYFFVYVQMMGACSVLCGFMGVV